MAFLHCITRISSREDSIFFEGMVTSKHIKLTFFYSKSSCQPKKTKTKIQKNQPLHKANVTSISREDILLLSSSSLLLEEKLVSPKDKLSRNGKMGSSKQKYEIYLLESWVLLKWKVTCIKKVSFKRKLSSIRKKWLLLIGEIASPKMKTDYYSKNAVSNQKEYVFYSEENKPAFHQFKENVAFIQIKMDFHLKEKQLFFIVNVVSNQKKIDLYP